MAKWLIYLHVSFLVSAVIALPIAAQPLNAQALSQPHTFAPMLERTRASVVGIYVIGREPIEQDNAFYHHPLTGITEAERRRPPKTRQFSASGSGVIISATNEASLILTNYHVIENADRIGVKLHDGRAFEAKLVGQDAATAVALLEIAAPKLSRLSFGKLEEVAVGDVVFAIGNPLGLSSTVTSGIVSSLFRSTVGYRDFEGFIQHDASINPGNSGGPLVNMRGELIGINTAIRSPVGASVGLAFAQPIGLMLKIAGQILKYGKVNRGEIGIDVVDLTPKFAAEHGLDVFEGAVVSSVRAGSPADKAGLKVDDVIVAMRMPVTGPFMETQGEPYAVSIRSRRSVETIIGIHAIGETVEIGFIRGKRRMAAVVTVDKLTKTERRWPAPKTVKRLGGLVVSAIGTSHPKFGEVHGALVVEIENGSISQFSGLLPKDIITQLNDHLLKSPEDLFDLAAHNGEDKLELKVIRDNVPILVRIPKL